MNDVPPRRLTAIAGIAVGLAVTVEAPLYFIYSGPPPAWNVYTRDLFTIVTCGLLLVFLAGLRHVLRTADPAYEWVAALVHGAGLCYVTVTLVAASLEAGGTFARPDGTVDPTTDGPLAQGDILLHGSVARMLTCVFLAAAGYAILRTRALPAWTGRAAYGVALCNLAFVPSIYFGNSAARFYSALGWGNSALTAGLVGYWILAVGIVLASRKRPVPN